MANAASAPAIVATEKRGRFTRAQGARSGAESYAIGVALPCLLALMRRRNKLRSLGWILITSLLLQLASIASIDRKLMWYYSLSQKFGPATMRNAVIGFARCVKPGGTPTSDHSLNLYHLPGSLTSVLFSAVSVAMLIFNPFVAFVRVFYPEHTFGCNRHRYLRLWLFFLKHPLAVQGEGPSNGDGLASINGGESLIYPLTPKDMERGPTDHDYWLQEEKRPRFRDMFHDKLFVHRFFKSHGASCPKIVAEVSHHKRRETFIDPNCANFKLIWKPRYSTMGLGIEWFVDWKGEATVPTKDGNWAPSEDPYIIEECIISTEHRLGEWYRMVTLWAYEDEGPKHSYIWRMRNKPGDNRVQTDIMGGAFCITEKYEPYIGPWKKGMSYDPRQDVTVPLHPKVHKALTKGIELQLKMHRNLGKELWSIGWDVMIRDEEPVFLEFNINNGFFVADHSVEECDKMCEFFGREFDARLPIQLLNFDPRDKGQI